MADAWRRRRPKRRPRTRRRAQRRRGATCLAREKGALERRARAGDDGDSDDDDDDDDKEEEREPPRLSLVWRLTLVDSGQSSSGVPPPLSLDVCGTTCLARLLWRLRRCGRRRSLGGIHRMDCQLEAQREEGWWRERLCRPRGDTSSAGALCDDSFCLAVGARARRRRPASWRTVLRVVAVAPPSARAHWPLVASTACTRPLATISATTRCRRVLSLTRSATSSLSGLHTKWTRHGALSASRGRSSSRPVAAAAMHQVDPPTERAAAKADARAAVVRAQLPLGGYRPRDVGGERADAGETPVPDATALPRRPQRDRRGTRLRTRAHLAQVRAEPHGPSARGSRGAERTVRRDESHALYL